MTPLSVGVLEVAIGARISGSGFKVIWSWTLLNIRFRSESTSVNTSFFFVRCKFTASEHQHCYGRCILITWQRWPGLHKRVPLKSFATIFIRANLQIKGVGSMTAIVKSYYSRTENLPGRQNRTHSSPWPRFSHRFLPINWGNIP